MYGDAAPALCCWRRRSCFSPLQRLQDRAADCGPVAVTLLDEFRQHIKHTVVRLQAILGPRRSWRAQLETETENLDGNRGFRRELCSAGAFASAALIARPRHLPALVRTLAARLGAALAVFVLVLLALRTAGVTDFGAKPTEFAGELRSPAHVSCRRPAHLRTVPVGANALGHHLHVLLAQAGVGAVLTRLRTLDAGLDARCVFIVCHLKLSL